MKPSARVTLFFPARSVRSRSALARLALARLALACLALACLALAACSSARTGVVNGALTTNIRPAVSVTAEKPFVLTDSGRIWVQPRTDQMSITANASFDYAVYADPAAASNARLAYAAVIRLEDRDKWAFFPDPGNLSGSFGSVKTPGLVSREGAVYTLGVPARGDWASDLVTANGFPAPESWLARRWVFMPDTDIRVMAEYREPWPAGLEAPVKDIMLLRDSDAEYLRAFEKRSDAVFAFSAELGDFSGAPATAPRWKLPRLDPDVPKLAGEIMFLENSGGDGGGAYD